MPAPLIALAVGAGMVSAIASIEEAEARAEQARREAALKRLQADETLVRAEINAKLMRREGERMQAGQAQSFAASGVDMGASQFGLLRETDRMVSEQIDLMKREAEFRARMLREGAISSDLLADDAETAGMLNAFSSLLGAGAGAARAGGYTSKPAKQPSID